MNFDVIIFISGSDPTRQRNLKTVLSCVKKQTLFPNNVFLVEQSINGDYCNKPSEPDINYIQIYSEVFNPSWCRNVGIYASDADYVIVVDADAIFGIDYFEKISTYFKDDVCIGWDMIIYFNEIGTRRCIENGFYDKWYDSEYIDRVWLPSDDPMSNQGLINIFNRKWFIDNFGGYCELLTKWGGEECELMQRIRTIKSPTWANIPVGHSDHPRVECVHNKPNIPIFEFSMQNPTLFNGVIKKYQLGSKETPLLEIAEYQF
jgi:hypothetical protein